MIRMLPKPCMNCDHRLKLLVNDYSESDKVRLVIATDRVIDSVWTCIFEVYESDKNPGEEVANILYYGHGMSFGYENERLLKQCLLNEKEGRIIISITLTDYNDMTIRGENEKTYRVVNQKYVFSYGA